MTRMLQRVVLCLSAFALISTADCFLGGAPLNALRSRESHDTAVTGLRCTHDDNGASSRTSRRDVLRVSSGFAAAAVLGSLAPSVEISDIAAGEPHHLWERWELRPASASAAYPTQSKAELIDQAEKILVSVKNLEGPLDFAYADWATNRTLSQQSYYLIQQSLSSGPMGILRKTCFKLYREHLVDAKQYKAGEEQYKKITASLDKLNSKLLKAARDQAKDEEVKTINVDLANVATNLDAFIKLVNPPSAAPVTPPSPA